MPGRPGIRRPPQIAYRCAPRADPHDRLTPAGTAELPGCARFVCRVVARACPVDLRGSASGVMRRASQGGGSSSYRVVLGRSRQRSVGAPPSGSWGSAVQGVASPRRSAGQALGRGGRRFSRCRGQRVPADRDLALPPARRRIDQRPVRGQRLACLALRFLHSFRHPLRASRRIPIPFLSSAIVFPSAFIFPLRTIPSWSAVIYHRFVFGLKSGP